MKLETIVTRNRELIVSALLRASEMDSTSADATEGLDKKEARTLRKRARTFTRLANQILEAGS